MTLCKSIEAAKEALEHYAYSGGDDEYVARKALAALPDKPMMERKISGIIVDALELAYKEDGYEDAYVIRALRDANALYVADGEGE